MNGRRLQFGIGVIDGLLFVVGGRDGLKTLNTVECFDPKKKHWTMMTSMGTHRHGLGQSLSISYVIHLQNSVLYFLCIDFNVQIAWIHVILMTIFQV